MNIVLCGMMGCGKTTVAASLAKRGYNVVDTDALIEERYGDISGIFDSYGEEYFRDIESRVVAEAAQKYGDAVISLGGGCVLREANVRNLKSAGKIFYLRTTAETLVKRLKGDRSRPLLKGGLEEKVNTILSARAKIYESVADAVIDTDGLTPDEIAIKIEESVI